MAIGKVQIVGRLLATKVINSGINLLLMRPMHEVTSELPLKPPSAMQKVREETTI
jgi:hypothetical protein